MLIDYLPPVLQDIREFIIICSIEDGEISLANESTDDFLKEQYIETCSGLCCGALGEDFKDNSCNSRFE